MTDPYTVVELLLYPVKSCRGISVPKACVSSRGFLYDRDWMVVTADKGRLITQLRVPKMALVETSLPVGLFGGQPVPSTAVLCMDAPGMPTLKVPVTRPVASSALKIGQRGAIVDVVVWAWAGLGIDEGPEASRWWTEYLGMPARLVRVHEDLMDRQVSNAPDGFVTGFSNTGQFLLQSEASLEDLNQRLEHPLNMNRFRPNLVIRGPRAYEEDEWRTFATVHNGQKLQFSFVKRCSRCRVPNINQETAEGPAFEPGQTLTTYRSGKLLGMDARDARQIFFATYFVCDRTTSLKKSPLNELPAVAVGDAIEILTWSPSL